MKPDRAVLAVVALGGALGAAARYALGLAFPDGSGFPWTTLAINLLGCLAIGVLIGALGLHPAPHRLARPLIGTGFLGGFTTFSTYAEQTRALLHSGAWGVATSYVAVTLVGALAAVFVGLWLVRALGRTVAHT